MAMNYEYERHIEAARKAGNQPAVEVLESHRSLFNTLVRNQIVEELPRETLEGALPQTPPEAKPLPTPEQLVISEKQAWKNFLGREIEVPTPPQELLDTLLRAKEQGITVFEAHYLPRVEFRQNPQHPGWEVKPGDWYWEKIKEGKVAKNAAKLDGIWVLVDTSPKPNYQDGNQEYPLDPFSQTLAKLRQEGQVKTLDYVGQTSRFAVSADELSQIVNPEIAKLLHLDKKQVRQPKEIEFNVIGNLHHPEWGQTNTWEWLDDKFGGDRRLFGGDSARGGLAHVSYGWTGHRDGRIGFRPLVVFPSSKS